jgi:hypothetical protein
MAQEVSRQVPTVVGWVWAQVRSCGVSGRQIDAGQFHSLLASPQFFYCIFSCYLPLTESGVRCLYSCCYITLIALYKRINGMYVSYSAFHSGLTSNGETSQKENPA